MLMADRDIRILIYIHKYSNTYFNLQIEPDYFVVQKYCIIGQ